MRKNIEKFVTGEELDSMNLIQIKITCANQALESFPNNLPKEYVGEYTKACIESLTQYKYLENDLWRNLRKNYDVAEEIFLDLESGQFYYDEVEYNKVQFSLKKL